MKLRDRNLITLFKALDGVSLTHEEIKSLEWIAGYEPSTVTNIASVITKAINTRPYPPKEKR